MSELMHMKHLSTARRLGHTVQGLAFVVVTVLMLWMVTLMMIVMLLLLIRMRMG